MAREIQKLNAVRGFACIYVLTHNYIYSLYSDEVVSRQVRLLFSAGAEAVMAFFMLSGFVIYLSVCQDPHMSWRRYFMKRFRRIYVPFLWAIAISILVFYGNGNLSDRFSVKDLLGNLIMLQDFDLVKPGTWFDPFLDNLPLWSLSYEWWFYMLFYPVYHWFGDRQRTIYFVLIFSVISYIIYAIAPNPIALIACHFIIWWSGVEAARTYLDRGTFSPTNMQPIFSCLLVMVGLSAVPLFTVDSIRLGYYPFLIFRHFVMSLVLLKLGLMWYRRQLKYFDTIFGWFACVAPISYSLYILQYPILLQWDLSAYIPHPLWRGAIEFGVLLGLCYLVELKLQPWVNQWLR
jgi:peptidoglycan/LPS O-acetylase OafA/YrhL